MAFAVIGVELDERELIASDVGALQLSRWLNSLISGETGQSATN
jgi:hypothetical protein